MKAEEYIRYRESKQHTRPGFAYNTYLCTIPQDFPNVPLHWHDEMEIIYIKKGCGNVTVQLRAFPVEAGCIVPVFPGVLHAIGGTDGARMEYENILFSRDLLLTASEDRCDSECLRPLLSGRLTLPAVLYPGTELHRLAAGCLDEADRACGEAAPGYSLLVKSALYRFFYTLYAAAGPEREASPRQTERIKKVLRYLSAHASEKLTVAEAAAQAGYSPAHFMRFFRDAVGQTFVEYLTDRRLAAAAQALTETDAPVSEIAGENGFDSLSYFCRRFHRKYGCSPGRYRNMLQKKP